MLARTDEITELAVPFSDDPNDGALRTPDGSSAYQYVSTLEYDEAAGTMTDVTTGTVYSDIGTGAFTSDDGDELLPGWQITVGFDNFVRAVTDPRLAQPLVYVTLWTFAFALISVASTFFLGLFLAIVFNDMRMRGRKFYRVLMILPVRHPVVPVGADLGGHDERELRLHQPGAARRGRRSPGSPIRWLAKVSVLIVNLWLGFPYMFLVCMGALQSIPDELQEAATVDGAKPWAVFRLIKLPLLLVTVAPLLIASFAFNFNNFNVIYMLTDGGPRDSNAPIPVGFTDILITMVYKVAFTGQSRDYGLASAYSIIIFIIVAVISIIALPSHQVPRGAELMASTQPIPGTPTGLLAGEIDEVTDASTRAHATAPAAPAAHRTSRRAGRSTSAAGSARPDGATSSASSWCVFALFPIVFVISSSLNPQRHAHRVERAVLRDRPRQLRAHPHRPAGARTRSGSRNTMLIAAITAIGTVFLGGARGVLVLAHAVHGPPVRADLDRRRADVPAAARRRRDLPAHERRSPTGSRRSA